MPSMSVGMAMGLLIVGNLIAVFSDALIKTLGQDIAVFQFVFFRQLTAVLILLPFCYRSNRKELLDGLKWHALRAHIWLMGAIFMVFSLNAMPLATANAIFYAAPLLMLPLALLLYREKLSRYSIAAGVLGFAGVIVIIRPTEFEWSALAALVVALTIAGNNLLIRKLPKHQSVAQTLLLTNLTGIPASLGLALWEGRDWDWSPLLTAAGSSSFILVYAGICVVAYRAAESNKIASAEYSGLLGAVAVGLVWFGETPDMITLVGTAMIILPLLWLAKIEKQKTIKD
ncbi:DMT family transporter [Photobacterium lutimaris]|uniref:EamA family transporter n=1 Tax=Photobacterium lutimaris TaxID=388278 RepID=A0A2T3J552_9GAMM|nr:DMT family transporter [Photobacterium lutimaris]PSU36423.1 EamA family transporter [Photobacterium lutimaris]TDR74675.1 drug/metabolite transporter (DMT)-like permease [Photobacterium lutimaris]